MLKNYLLSLISLSSILVSLQSINETEQSLAHLMLSNAPSVDISKQVQDILQKGTDINKPAGELDQTPLMIAAERYESTQMRPPYGKAYNYITIFKDILNASGLNINAQDKNGKTVAMYIVNNISQFSPISTIDVLKNLLSKGADFGIKDHNGKTVLDYVKNEEVKKYLQEILAGHKDYYSEIRILYAMERFKKTSGSTRILLIKNLISNDVNFNIPFDELKQTVLMIVAQSYWEQYKEPCTTHVCTDPWVHQKLLPIILAVPNLNVNAQDINGKTALMYLVEATPEKPERDPITPIKALVDKGADIKIKDHEGKTAYDYTNNEKVKQYLFDLSIGSDK